VSTAQAESDSLGRGPVATGIQDGAFLPIAPWQGEVNPPESEGRAPASENCGQLMAEQGQEAAEISSVDWGLTLETYEFALGCWGPVKKALIFEYFANYTSQLGKPDLTRRSRGGLR